ncbi:lysozyme [Fimbriiglobus ruber]|uniref:Lysozyme n=1 Tax=Fimbriiglobus ruber TaxID=1908690 RepID=A0A225D5X5_9BACT|nr:lysozyme [Fimbriiglobus ruber]OWK36991.1 Phage lysin [Fimbriiglobus ruber]
MKTSPAGITFIQSFEQLRLQRYLDSAGRPSIGWGHLIVPGEDYQLISPEQAGAIFLQDLSVAERAINQAVEVLLSQNEYDACASLAFNVGAGNFARSTLVKLLNSGNTALAAQQFLRWDFAGGKESPGLWGRRVAEKAIFEDGVYTNHA